MLWKNPIYKFRIPKEAGREECLDLNEIVFDVTGSAPPFTEPSKNLKATLKELFESSSFKKIENVLEFGAAKLKNIPFILEQGKSVCAVEFKELTKSSVTKKNIKKCKKYGTRFKNLIFPNPFIKDPNKVDLVLLANVLPVMPVFAERLFVLQLVYNKVQEGKYLLWVAQKEGSYKKIREAGQNNCGDGIWMGKNRYFKTFYKYHKIEDLDEMMSLCGFKLVKHFIVGEDIRLYEKTEHNLFAQLLTPEKIRAHIQIDKSIKKPENATLKTVKKRAKTKQILPNPTKLSLESLYIEKIKSIPEGVTPELYHRIISHAIARIFRGSLRNMEIKQEIDGGIKIIDTIFTNCAEKGFFKSLQNKIECNYPILEAKNLSGDPTNPDVDQLNGRLNANHGKFGILACRKVKNEEDVYKRCQTHLPERHILFLTDEDIIELLEHSRDGNANEISDFMDKKLRQLLYC